MSCEDRLRRCISTTLARKRRIQDQEDRFGQIADLAADAYDPDGPLAETLRKIHRLATEHLRSESAVASDDRGIEQRQRDLATRKAQRRERARDNHRTDD